VRACVRACDRASILFDSADWQWQTWIRQVQTHPLVKKSAAKRQKLHVFRQIKKNVVTSPRRDSALRRMNRLGVYGASIGLQLKLEKTYGTI
jgi:hypothetical protein